jgi:VCBS repeat-containing protein
MTITPSLNFSDAIKFGMGDKQNSLTTRDFQDDGNLYLLTTNSGPIARSDSATTSEDASVIINVLANDSDPNHDQLSVNGLTTNMTRGSVIQNGNRFTYDPGNAFQYLTAGQIANDNFYYTVTDGITTNNAEVYLNIIGVNDAPVNNVPQNQLVQKNAPIVFSSANDNSISIQDVDVGTSPLSVTLSASNGLLSLSNTSELSFQTGDGTNDATITFTGTLSNINNALEGLSFSPNANYTGAAGLTISSNDQTHLNDTDTIALTVALVGTNGNDSLNGTVGDDTIYGLAGNDTIFGNEGLNIIDGGDGKDLIFGGSQTDTICGGDGNDRIFASNGNNTVWGGNGNDVIFSGTGNDLINGGPGNDTIWLGAGGDTVVIAQGNGTDTIYNFQAGQTQIGLADGLQFSDLAISQGNNATLIRAGTELLASLLFVQATTINTSSFVSV